MGFMSNLLSSLEQPEGIQVVRLLEVYLKKVQTLFGYKEKYSHIFSGFVYDRDTIIR